jgi:PEP-CTERM motif-containing protein
VKILFMVLTSIALAQFAFAQQSVDGVATPEPGTILLMATGLAGVGYGVWRRNRSK